MKSNDFVSIENLLAEILPLCDDITLRNGFSKGWYASQVQQAVEELAIDTFFSIATKDYPIDKDKLQLVIEEGFFNIRNIIAYKGKIGELTGQKKVHYKVNFNNLGGGKKYSANVIDSGSSFPHPIYHNVSAQTNLLWYNIESGVLMLSYTMADYDFLRITMNTFGGEIGDIPIVPRFLRKAVTEFVCEKYFAVRYARTKDKNDLQNQQTYYNKLYVGTRNVSNPGTWLKAERRIKTMDSAEKNDLFEYYHSMQY